MEFRHRQRLRDRSGFTLIELLVVVTVIGILVAIALPKLFQALTQAKQGRTVANMQSVRSALQQYFLDHGEDEQSYYPWNLQQVAKYYPDGVPSGCGTHAGAHHYIENIPFEEVGNGPQPGNQITDWCTGPGHEWHLNRSVQGVDDGNTAGKGGWNWCIPGGTPTPTAAPSGTIWIDENVVGISGKSMSDL